METEEKVVFSGEQLGKLKEQKDLQNFFVENRKILAVLKEQKKAEEALIEAQKSETLLRSNRVKKEQINKKAIIVLGVCNAAILSFSSWLSILSNDNFILFLGGATSVSMGITYLFFKDKIPVK